jgi:hypothetical protein
MTSSVDTLLKALKRAAKFNDGSLEDERRQDELFAATDACKERIDYHTAVDLRVDNWLPACNGLEQPFMSRGGLRLMYCWNPATGQHRYINLGTDMILSDEEAEKVMR